MTEETSSDGPDLSDWVRRLHDRLEAIGEEYHRTPWAASSDPEAFEGLNLKQARAAEVLLTTCTALRELPVFKKSKGAAVLHDVAGALRDVVMGGSPRLFSPARLGSPGGDGVYRLYLRVHVVTGVRFLIDAHKVPEGQARKRVADIFAAAGAKGRTGAPLSATTVKDWCDRAHPLALRRDDRWVHEQVEAKLERFRSDPAWPGEYRNAIAYIERVAADPLLSSKYG